MEIILWIILGYIIGWVAPDTMKVHTGKSMIIHLFLGILGALVGGYLTTKFIYSSTPDINLFSVIIATIGSILFMRFGKKLDNI